MTSDFIPNSFQTPNAYVDRFMPYLTAEEWKVLCYMVRRIFGFHKRQDRIAYSQIMNGLISEKGERLDYGTGLGMAATENAVKSLVKYRLVVKLEDNNPKENKGALYALQLESEYVDLEGLEARHKEKLERENARMSKAREARTITAPPINGQTPHYPIMPPSPNPITQPPPLSNNGHNNQGNPDRKPDSGAAAPEPEKPKKPSREDSRTKHPAIQLVKGVTGHLPPKGCYDFLIKELGESPDGKRFAGVHTAWCARGFRPTNFDGQVEWYKNGIPGHPNGYGKPKSTQPAEPPLEEVTEEEKAAQRAAVRAHKEALAHEKSK